ncbi:MAG: hypothetical protein ABIH34_05900 [Nanoarchaeota archaeon]
MGSGQAAMEYLVVISFALLLIVPIVIIFFSQSEDVTEQLSMNQLREIGRKIVTTSEKVYYLGEPSQTTLKVYMPSQVEKIIIDGKTLIFNVSIARSTSEVVFMSTVNMTGDITPISGVRFILIKTEGGKVNITDA